ncbi:MAG TPA: TM1266 family iron-only hydrogenase system putative regulator [Clostridia bacterium]|nr:TM1266 family iron-only hydrogenase system putative regulator [Clostridia bacterium]
MESRLGVIGIIIEDRKKTSEKINSILSRHGKIIVGRMGVPYQTRQVSIIALIVDGTTDEIGALTGKLGNISGITVKTVLAPEPVK